MPISSYLHGFHVEKIQLNSIEINFATGGSGPPVLLLHGHPQTHVVWREVAPLLVEAGYSVVAPDLRGYGDSEKPSSDRNHMPYSKRVMAEDQIKLMQYLQHEKFYVVGHDRGGRVAHRLCLDFPNFVKKWVVLDIAPTKTMYDLTDREFATSYFWWFFFIQPYDFPERLIGSDPEYFLRHHINGQIKVDGSVPEVIFKEYLRTYMKSSTIHAICEDYRASATIDLEHDLIDAEERINAPLLALWGDMSVVGKLYDVKDTWQKKAVDVDGFGLPCGHSIPEECPKELVKLLLNFF